MAVIKTSDLIQDDNLKDLEERFTRLAKHFEDQMAAMKKQAKEFQETLSGVNVSGGQGNRQQVKNTIRDIDKLRKEFDKLSNQHTEVSKTLEGVKMAQAKVRRETKLNIKQNAAAEGSYDQLSAKYSLLKMELNAMSKAERENTKEGKKMVKQAKAIYQEMDRLQKATGKSQLSVGRYGDAIKGLGGKMMGFLGVAGGVIGIVTGLFKAFTKTEKGAQFMTKVTGALSGAMSVLGDITVNISDALTNAFTDPQQALKDFGGFLVSQITNRIKASIELAGVLGSAFKQLFTGEWSKLGETVDDAGDALSKLVLGLDDKGLDDFSDAVKSVSENIKETTDSFIQLNKARRIYREQNARLKVEAEELAQAEALYKSMADDTTVSLEERDKFAKRSAEAMISRYRKEVEIAENNLNLIDREIAIRNKNGEDVLALQEQRSDAAVALAQAEGEYTLAMQENIRTRNEIEQDSLERSLDVLIDGFDNQKTINERRIADDKLSFEARRQIANDTEALAQKSFDKQIELLQGATDQTLDANKLINESDAVRLDEMVKNSGLSDILQGRLLEAIRDRKTATYELYEAQRDLNDAEVKSIKDAEKLAEGEMDKEVALRQKAELLKFKNAGASEKELQKLRLTHEMQLLQIQSDRIDKTDTLAKDAINQQIQYTQSQIDDLDTPDAPQTIFDMVGIDLSDEGQKAVGMALDSLTGMMQSFTQSQIEEADKRLEARRRETDEAKRLLDIEIQNRNAGYAANVQDAERNLLLAKEREKKALEQKKQAQLAQLRLDTALQASSLITAAAGIWRDLKFPFAIPAIAAMFGSFIAAKAKAFSVASQDFADGDLTIIGGGRHGSTKNGVRNDTLVGFSGNKAQFAEQGEARMILSRRATAKYKSMLPHLFESLSKGTFEESFLNRANTQIQPAFNIVNNTDMKKAENELETIRKQGEHNVYYLNGMKVTKNGNKIIKANV